MLTLLGLSSATEVPTQTSRQPDAIPLQDAAIFIGVTELTVRRWIKRGYIKALRVGPKLIRIPVTEVRRMRLEYIRAVGGRPEYPSV